MAAQGGLCQRVDEYFLELGQGRLARPDGGLLRLAPADGHQKIQNEQPKNQSFHKFRLQSSASKPKSAHVLAARPLHSIHLLFDFDDDHRQTLPNEVVKGNGEGEQAGDPPAEIPDWRHADFLCAKPGKRNKRALTKASVVGKHYRSSRQSLKTPPCTRRCQN